MGDDGQGVPGYGVELSVCLLWRVDQMAAGAAHIDFARRRRPNAFGRAPSGKNDFRPAFRFVGLGQFAHEGAPRNPASGPGQFFGRRRGG